MSTASPKHQCSVCNRVYERHDHLSRHLKSHENERGYRCEECGKGFNRADLLNRHRTAHAKAARGESIRRRTSKACKACISAKTKCDDQRPCKRCRTREISCEDTEARSSHQDDASTISRLSVDAQPQYAQSQAMFDNAVLAGDMNMQQSNDPFNVDSVMLDDFSFPDFFEQIMMPDGSYANTIAMPPDVSDFTRDYNFGFNDSDFLFMLNAPIAQPVPSVVQESIPISSGGQQVEPTATPPATAHQRSEAFKKSPWSWYHWIPPRNHHAFTDQENITVEEDGVSPKDQFTPSAGIRQYNCELSQRDRDRMLNVVAQVAHLRNASIPTFPSLDFLNDLVDIFLSQETNATTAIIHIPSIRSGDIRAELLLAMCAAGASFVAHRPTWKLGLLVQEIVRVAAAEAMERDNSLTRDLQTEQCWTLWLNVGVWSGFRRKTEMASCFLQPLYAMFAWSYTFTKHRYKDIVPAIQDSPDVLEEKWRKWADQEGRKRLAIYVFLHDIQIAFIQMRNPILSCAEMLLPVPAEKELWLAPDAHSWRNRYLSMQRPNQAELPSMVDVFADISVLDRYSGLLDKDLCGLTACYALAHEVSEFRKQSNILRHRAKSNQRDRKYGHVNWQRDLLDDIRSRQTYCEVHFPHSLEMQFTLELLTMSLHVSLDDIQLFSGKAGEEEARKAYPLIRDWSETSESRLAVWHAGQVLRIARAFEQTKLRDFYAVAVYNAALILYIYGMVTCKARRSGMQTPVKSNHAVPSLGASMATNRQPVFLDAADEKAAQAFTLLGHGLPGIQSHTEASSLSSERSRSSPPGFCALQNARGVMTIAADVLKNNFPLSIDGLPPLVENLRMLMKDLC